MYVPNYVPEPLEVPGNITLAPYGARVRFIRRVTLLHILSLACVAGLAMLSWPSLGVLVSLGGLSSLLILLELLRIAYRGRRREYTISCLALPLVLLGVSWAAHSLRIAGYPVWALLIGPAFAGLYTVSCGRDYSFLGAGIMSLAGSTIAVAALCIQLHLSAQSSWWALIVNAVYLIYFVYDLAALMARRRSGEELAAVVDLYRDVFNLFGYIVRIIGHWKKHKIWVAPR